MKKIFILIIVIVNTTLYSQKDAFVIRHIGMADAFIYPVVFSSGTITHSFLEKHINYNIFKFDTLFLDKIRINKADLNELANCFFYLTCSLIDTSRFNHSFGTFDFFFIQDDIIIKKIQINDRSLSIKILNEFYEQIDRLEIENEIKIKERIEYLIKRMMPNPTLRIVEEEDR